MEDDKDRSMSDKDRKMAGRFEGFGFNREDDEEKKDKKGSRKVPKRSLFLGKETAGLKPEATGLSQEARAEKKGLFAGLLKDRDIQVEAAPEADTTFLKGAEPRNESSGELTDEFQEVVIDRLQEVGQELESSGAAEHAEELTANAEFLEHVGERLEEGLPPAEAIDDALEDTYQPPKADAEPADMAEEEYFGPPETAEEEPEPPRTIVSPPSPPLPQPGFNQSPPPHNPNTASNPNVVPMNEIYYRDKRKSNLLLGGALGYLFGRRRGRIKAEGQLEPKIDKRDTDIETLSSKLRDSELRVRAEALKKTPETTTELPLKAAPEKAAPPLRKIVERLEAIPVETIDAEKQIVQQQEQQFEANLEAELEQDAARQKKRLEAKPESQPEAAEKIRDPRSMPMPELLEVAEHISLEKTSLRELYERHRIDAINLRRVITEYMNGGTRYERILRGSLEAVEMQRELRGEIRQDADFKASSPVQNDDAKPADAVSHDQADAAQDFAAGADQQATNHPAKTFINERPDDRMMVSNGTAIVIGILTGVVIMMLVFLYSR